MVPNRYDCRHIWCPSWLRLQAYMIPIETETVGIFGPLLNQECRHIWSPSWLRLQEYLVPITTKIASIIGPPYIMFVFLFSSSSRIFLCSALFFVLGLKFVSCSVLFRVLSPKLLLCSPEQNSTEQNTTVLEQVFCGLSSLDPARKRWSFTSPLKILPLPKGGPNFQ